YFDAWAHLGVLYIQAGRFTDAESALQKAAALKSNNEIENHLGVAYLNQNKFSEAEAQFRKSIRLNGNFFLPHFNLGVVLQHKRDFSAAEQSYIRALSLNPEYIPALLNLAIVQTELGKKEQAADNLRRFIQQAPPQMQQQIADARQRLAALESEL
ncbi:MAG: tetratricopeptide repeat protein, partial [Leptospiraceae bacterium]|nr:tetratricopeptide repeat protein [Leptospiraceae bacterium]